LRGNTFPEKSKFNNALLILRHHFAVCSAIRHISISHLHRLRNMVVKQTDNVVYIYISPLLILQLRCSAPSTGMHPVALFISAFLGFGKMNRLLFSSGIFLKFRRHTLRELPFFPMLTNLITALGAGDAAAWATRDKEMCSNSAAPDRKIDLFQRKIDFLPISCVTA
jgi:hypothetical protein